MKRWAIYIDIEGTSKIYEAQEAQFYIALDALVTALCQISTIVFPESPSRLFLHRVGADGALIVSEFAEGQLETPISIAVVLMQVIIANGFVGKAGISDGSFADVKSSFPTLRSFPEQTDATSKCAEWLLTAFPVMGTALINAHRLGTCKPRGARLAVDATIMTNIPEGVVISYKDKDVAVVDWIHTQTRMVEEIISKTHIQLPSRESFRETLRNYVATTGDTTDGEWKHYTLCLNGLHDHR